MQYIQLQGQVAETLDTPLEGGFNLFIDTADGTIKAKDSEGNLTGGGAGGGLVDTTYNQLTASLDGGSLTPGTYYKITDFRTYYDQPDYDATGTAIEVGNYKSGSLEPLVVLAISSQSLSTFAYSPSYPSDVIKYDVTFTQTEVTAQPAKGRIFERIDERNNRADYDFRGVKFKRYKGFYCEDYFDGVLSVNDVDGSVTGSNTSFTSDFSVGDALGVYSVNNNSQIGAFRFYEIIDIASSTRMSITGSFINSHGEARYSKGIEFGAYRSPIQCNAPTYSGSAEYYTFDNSEEISCYNTYLGNNVDYNTFILSNNVFFGGNYENNYFAGNVVGNTFDDDMDGNQCGANFEFNIITNDFDGNKIGSDFNRNIIVADFNYNTIGMDFSQNTLGDEDEDDFQNNIIGNYFSRNFITMDEDFENNRIGDGFNQNIIHSHFYRNNIGNDFSDNVVNSEDFQNNEIGNQFNNNEIYDDFYKNDIGNGFHSNTIRDEFYGNLIGNGYNENQILDQFNDNQIGEYFNENDINYDFSDNKIGTGFENNNINMPFGGNSIGNEFEYNNIGEKLFGWDDLTNIEERNYDDWRDALDGNVGNNIIGTELIMSSSTNQYFKIKFNEWTQNAEGGGFAYERTEIDRSGTVIGETVTFIKNDYTSSVDIIISGSLEITRGNQNGIYNIAEEEDYENGVSPIGTVWNSVYTANNINYSFNDNSIQNNFSNNEIGPNFAYNQIRNDFNNNTIGDDFGFGGGNHRGNVIGNHFYSNTIGEYFYDNNIGDNFEDNTVGNYFQFNRIETALNGYDFTEYYGNIVDISYPTTNGTDGTYTSVSGSTSGIGVTAIFDVVVTNDLVDTVTTTNAGKLYQVDDTITIASASFGGDTDLVLTVTDTSYRPEVYASYNKTIQRASDGYAVLTVIRPGEGYYPFITPDITQAID